MTAWPVQAHQEQGIYWHLAVCQSQTSAMCVSQETLLHSACFQSSLGSQNVSELKRFAVGSLSLLHLDPKFPRAGIFFFFILLTAHHKGPDLLSAQNRKLWCFQSPFPSKVAQRTAAEGTQLCRQLYCHKLKAAQIGTKNNFCSHLKIDTKTVCKL